MTLESIDARVKVHENEGRLVRYIPKSRAKPRRRLYLTKNAMKKLNDDSSAVNILVGRGKIEAALTRWGLGDLVYGEKKKAKFLKRLDAPPPEIWEIRVTEPNAQARIFGRFLAPDCFIATEIFTRQLLGKRGSSAWKGACQDCVNQWGELFPGNSPFSGSNIHAYVTENCDDFDI